MAYGYICRNAENMLCTWYEQALKGLFIAITRSNRHLSLFSVILLYSAISMLLELHYNIWLIMLLLLSTIEDFMYCKRVTSPVFVRY